LIAARQQAKWNAQEPWRNQPMSRIDTSIEINAPIEECYQRLLHFEEYPRFIPNLSSIRRKGDRDVWQWQLNIGTEKPLSWDIELDGARHQRHTISWHTVRDSDVAHSGAVTLRSRNGNRTELHLVVEYTPYTLVSPAEKDIEQSVRQCLRSFKNHLELGARAFSQAGIPETWEKM
jgi:uncharacterized membrane protein